MTFRILPHELIVIAVLVSGGIGASETSTAMTMSS